MKPSSKTLERAATKLLRQRGLAWDGQKFGATSGGQRMFERRLIVVPANGKVSR